MLSVNSPSLVLLAVSPFLPPTFGRSQTYGGPYARGRRPGQWDVLSDEENPRLSGNPRKGLLSLGGGQGFREKFSQRTCPHSKAQSQRAQVKDAADAGSSSCKYPGQERGCIPRCGITGVQAYQHPAQTIAHRNRSKVCSLKFSVFSAQAQIYLQFNFSDLSTKFHFPVQPHLETSPLGPHQYQP